MNIQHEGAKKTKWMNPGNINLCIMKLIDKNLILFKSHVYNINNVRIKKTQWTWRKTFTICSMWQKKN